MAAPQNNVEEAIEQKGARDPGFAIAYALMRVAESQDAIARALHELSRQDGAVEMGLHIVREALNKIAEAIEDKG